MSTAAAIPTRQLHPLVTLDYRVRMVSDDRDRGLAMGAADYFVKPVDRDRLAEILAAYRSGALA